MNDLKISAVISCYHGVKTIQKAVESLTEQNLKPNHYEIIIIDNGSIDGSSNIINSCIQKYRSTRNIIAKRIENEGLSNARNVGWEISNSPLIFYMDDDAVADKNCLGNIIDTFETHSDINTVGGKVEILNPHSEFAQLYHHSIFNFWMKERRLIIGTNMSFRKTFLESTTGFLKDLVYRGDESAFFQKNIKKVRSHINNEIIVYHTQPEKYDRFFKSRYENGLYKKYRITEQLDKNLLTVIKLILNITLRFINLIIIPLLFSIHIVDNKFSTLLTALIFGIFISRNIVQYDLVGSIIEFAKSGLSSRYRNSYLKVCSLILIGNFYEDLGFIRGLIR